MRTLSLARAFARPAREVALPGLAPVARARAAMIATALLTDLLMAPE